ncbi:MAG: putative Blue copper protein [Nitrospira sp.]|jgi:plastocyanin|nr:putative Blue copper protein [Nitrospira sp.]
MIAKQVEEMWGGGRLWLAACFVLALCSQGGAQAEQRIEVTIKDFTFLTKQIPLRLGVATVIAITNQDQERHDFGSTMFEGIPTRVESEGIVSYGRGIGGLFLDGKKSALIRFTMERPGRHEFRCSIHPNMKGELLLLNVEAV